MKKGVVISGCLALVCACCVPAVAQPSAKAVETIVIDNFDTPDDMEWTWDVKASRFVTEGYPIIKNFEGIPNSLRPYRKDGDPTAQVLGVKVAYDRKGDNWFEVYPTKDGEAYEIPFLGTVTQIDFWVWGANYLYRLEVLVRDAYGSVHVLKVGDLKFQGWKNMVVNVPGRIRQHSKFRTGEVFRFVGFRIRSDVTEAVDDYTVYFDQLKYTTNTLVNIYDGYDLRQSDFGDSDNAGGSGSDSSSSDSSGESTTSSSSEE
ncbi:MAG: flagellar filament protein FlaA [Treponema sp.]|nr:flagellar filament protein FlaA [Treponema sp.]